MNTVLRLLICFVFALPRVVSADPPATLGKYLKPAQISELDWLLIRAQVSSFASPLRWDERGLIMSIELYVAKDGLVGMTFVVDRERYVNAPDDVVTKVFSDAVVQASNILMHTIPEVKGGANVYANFVALGGGIVAEYQHGHVSLRPS